MENNVVYGELFRKGRFVYMVVDGVLNTVTGWCRVWGITRTTFMYRYETMGLRGKAIKLGANRVPKELTVMLYKECSNVLKR